MNNWKVMRLCEKQLRDINPSDVLFDGLYRRCDTYKGGGGYDEFPAIFNKRHGTDLVLNEQFVIQLKGCPLNCPYCYVTRDGVCNGDYVEVSTEKLLADFEQTGFSVFHLMGGAPALYISSWEEIASKLPDGKIFHSDILLVEGEYDREVIKRLAQYSDRSLHAVSIKGYSKESFYKNTRTELNADLLWSNLDTIVDAQLPFYLTYTGMSVSEITAFKKAVLERYGKSIGNKVCEDDFSIQVRHYNALD